MIVATERFETIHKAAKAGDHFLAEYPELMPFAITGLNLRELEGKLREQRRFNLKTLWDLDKDITVRVHRKSDFSVYIE